MKLKAPRAKERHIRRAQSKPTAYSQEIIRLLRWPSEGSTPWSQDRICVLRAMELCLKASKDHGLSPGQRADALEVYVGLCKGDNSPLMCTTQRTGAAQFLNRLNELAQVIEAWHTVDHEDIAQTISRLRKEQEMLDQVSHELVSKLH